MDLHVILQFARASLAGGVFAIFLLEAFLFARQRRRVHGYAAALLLITTGIIVARIFIYGATDPEVARTATRFVWAGLFLFAPLCTLSIRRVARLEPSVCTRATTGIGILGALAVWVDGPVFASGHRMLLEITGHEVFIVNLGWATPLILVPYVGFFAVDLINITIDADFEVAPLSWRGLAFSLLLLIAGSLNEVFQILGLYRFVGTLEFALGVATVSLLFVFAGYAARAVRALERDVEQTNDALAGTVESLRGLISGLPDMVLVARGGMIEPYNARAVDALGAAPLTSSDLAVDENSAEQLDELLEQASSTPSFSRLEITTPDGSEAVDIVAVAAEIDGERVVIANARATRERDELERQLRLADRLSSLGTMAAGVAHEINNPIAYIAANLDYCVTELDPDPDRAEEVEALRSAMRGTERVARIVRDLGTFARFEHESSPSIGEVHDALDIALGIARSTLRHNVELENLVPEDLPAVALDTGRLSQVLLNLIINASDAMPDERDRSENRIRVGAESSSNGVIVTIADNGVGMNDRQVEKAFNPFFTTKDVGEGTGLGLSICHTIVEQTGGSISLESQLGEGTTFTLLLPVSEAPMVESSREQTSGPTSAKILLIDDDPMVLRSTQRLLLLSYEVETASTPDEAMKKLGESEFDAILCDVMMPDQNGLEFYDRVAENHPELSRKFIYFTGGVVGKNIKDALGDAGVPIISKPLDRSELDSAIMELRLAS